MAALTALIDKIAKENFGVATYKVNGISTYQGQLMGLDRSTGYAIAWTGAADIEFIGTCVKTSPSSATTIQVFAIPQIVTGHTTAAAGTSGVTVAGVTAVTDIGKPVYCATDNWSADLTLTPTAGQAIGYISQWVATTKCFVVLTPKGYGTATQPSDFILGDNLAAALDIRESGTSYMVFVTTDGSEKITVSKTLDLDNTLDQDVALTGTGDAANITATMSHASQTAEGLDVSIAQITNARTSGEIIGVKSTVTSLTGSTAGTDHSAFYAGVTVGAAAADHFAFKQGAGFDATIDASGCATGEAAIQMPDNVAIGFELREATTPYLTVVTTDSSEAINLKVRTTTTDGVASGDARRVGGIAYVQTAASTAITGTASETLFDTSAYLIPANTLKAGTMLRVYFQCTATATNANDTLTVKLVLGGTAANTTGTAILTTALPDATNGDIICGWFILTPRAAPGATAACVGYGYQSNGVIGTIASLPVLLASTNFATNGALGIKLTGTWSSNSGSNSCRSDVFVVEII